LSKKSLSFPGTSTQARAFVIERRATSNRYGEHPDLIATGLREDREIKMHARLTAPLRRPDLRQNDSTRKGFGVPAPMRHPMPIRDIEIWTPFSIVKAFLGLLTVPARRVRANDV